MDQRQPPAKSRPPRRLTHALAVAAAFVNNGILYEIIPVFGSARVKARIKTAGANGAIDLVFVGTDFDPSQTAAFASLAGTKYTTGNPTQVAVTAGTEAEISADCYGEGYVIVKFTGAGTGTIAYCDVSQV